MSDHTHMDWQHPLVLGKYEGVVLEGVSPKNLLLLHGFMTRLRMLEERISHEYHPANEMACPVHLCIGQEAVPAALSLVLQPHDFMFSHHRSHGYYLAKGGSLRLLMAELYGKATGANGGLAGSQDISLSDLNFYGGAILTGAVGISVGAGLSLQLQNSPGIVVTGFGDGATDEGIFWEAINYAALKKLPVLFVCENNGYATYSPQAARQARTNISEKVDAFGVPTVDLFGNDAVEVFRTLTAATDRIRAGEGPVFVQAFTYRLSSHVGPEDDGAVGYRSAFEKDAWRNNCPISLLTSALFKNKLLDSASVEALVCDVRREIDDAFAFAKASPFTDPIDWHSLNLCATSPLADRLLAEEDEYIFDGRQQDSIPGPY